MAYAALTIAGSDSGGGAGVQADLKAFSARGVFGASAITAITAQNTQDVTAVAPVENKVVAAQIAAIVADIQIHAIKIGMLGTPDLIETVRTSISAYSGPVVLDPVMLSKSGVALLPDSSVAALIEMLIPRATVLTPNLPEAACILDCAPAETDSEMRRQGEALIALGAQAVVMKGGHASGDECRDWLITKDGAECYKAPRIHTRNTHGTGCSYSSAIAAELAKGEALQTAVANAHSWLHKAIRSADQLKIGHGHGPVHHFHEFWA